MSAAPEPVVLQPDAPEFIVRPMLTTDRAIDLYLGDCGLAERTRTTYSRSLTTRMNKGKADN